MRRLVLALIFLGWVSVTFAAENEIEGYFGQVDHNWRVDGQIQFHGLSDDGRALIGPAISFEPMDGHFWGARAMLSVGTTGSYLFQFFYQYPIYQSRVRLFLEPAVALNLVNRGTQMIPSGGLALGVDYAVSSDVSLGGSAGFEAFGIEAPYAAYSQIGSVYFTPKVLLTASFHF